MSSEAKIIYETLDNKELVLDRKSLRELDLFTMGFLGTSDLKTYPNYKSKINYFIDKYKLEDDGCIKLQYIKDKVSKEELPFVFSERSIPSTKKDIYSNTLSTFEEARKLLWSSKNKEFLKLYLEDERLFATSNFYLEVDGIKEYKSLMKYGIPIYKDNDNINFSFRELLTYVFENSSYELKPILESSLESWRNLLEGMENEEEKYYYARELQRIKNIYLSKLHKIDKISNLKFSIFGLKMMMKQEKENEKRNNKLFRRIKKDKTVFREYDQ